MKKYDFNASLEKWLYQNDGEIVEILEGCLLDSYLIETKRGTAAIMETYATPNSSKYTLYFSTDDEAAQIFYKAQEAREAWDAWEVARA